MKDDLLKPVALAPGASLWLAALQYRFDNEPKCTVFDIVREMAGIMKSRKLAPKFSFD
jgi:hypothetical protein